MDSSSPLSIADLKKYRFEKIKVEVEDNISDITASTPDLEDDRSITPPIPGCREVNLIPETPESQIGLGPGGLPVVVKTEKNVIVETEENVVVKTEENGSSKDTETTIEQSQTDSETYSVIRKKSGIRRIIITDSDESDKEQKPVISEEQKIKFNQDRALRINVSSFTKRRKATTVLDFPPMCAELFNNRELGLKTMKDAFPKMDLMEVQDVLMSCDWNSMKAFHVIRDGCPVKKCEHFPEQSLPSNSSSPLIPDSPTKLSPEREEILPDIFSNGSEQNQTFPPKKSKLRELSSSSEDDVKPFDRESARTPSPDIVLSKRKAYVLSSSSDDDRINQSVSVNYDNLPVHRNQTHQLSEDDESKDSQPREHLALNGNAAESHRSMKHKKHKRESKGRGHRVRKEPKGAKKKRRDVGRDDDDDDEGNYDDEVYNSDDSDIGEVIASPARKAVVRFYQEATPAEILSVPGCSKKKMDAVLSRRPFDSWQDLVTKFQNDRVLTTDLLNGASEVIQMREVMTKLLNRCEKFSGEMEKLLAIIMDDEKPKYKGYLEKQPQNLNKELKLAPYQMFGLNWLALMHFQELNGILADEMGLGKTIQAIAFLAHLNEINEKGPHLIVVPASTLSNWEREIETWCSELSIIMYRGSQNERRELRLQLVNGELEDYSILLTTYNMVVTSPEDRNLFRKLGFNYVIFDEAHMLKNMSSMRYKHLMKIKARRRLCLTGTPLQNNLVELMSLLIFVMPGMFHGKIEQVKRMFTSSCKTDDGKSDHERDRIEHAKRIMKPFVLRRLKCDVLKELPSKVDEVRYCALTESQQKIYDDMISRLSDQVEDRENVITSEKMSGMGMLMELRKQSNHPLLRRNIFEDSKLRKMSKLMLKESTHRDANPQLIFEDMQVMSDFELHKLCQKYKSVKQFRLDSKEVLNSGKFKVLDEVLPSWKEEAERVLIFSQFTMMLDIIEEYMSLKGHKFLRLDGQTAVGTRQELIDKFNSDGKIFAFLLSTRAGGLGINLTAASKVILHDIDYNPYNDKQAEDRCHRIGQTKEVTIVRLICKGTIEEGMLKCAQDKLKLGRDITSEEQDEDDSNVANNLLRAALHLQK